MTDTSTLAPRISDNQRRLLCRMVGDFRWSGRRFRRDHRADDRLWLRHRPLACLALSRPFAHHIYIALTLWFT